LFSAIDTPIIERAETGIRAPAPALATSTLLEARHVMAAPNPIVSVRSGNAVVSITPATRLLDDAGNDWSWAYDVFPEIPGCPGYAAGFYGSVWSRRIVGARGGIGDRWHFLCPTILKSGYLLVGVADQSGHRRTRLVHQLVTLAWLGRRPAGKEVRHFPDPDKSNNSVPNLRYGTRQENHEDSRALDRYSKGSDRWKAILKETDIPEIRRLLAAGVKQKEIGRRFGVGRQAIGDIKSGRNWGHVL
jgi:hypothetical protein